MILFQCLNIMIEDVLGQARSQKASGQGQIDVPPAAFSGLSVSDILDKILTGLFLYISCQIWLVPENDHQAKLSIYNH
jgi:hypothetical protein